MSARGVAIVVLLLAARGGEAAERLRVSAARAGLYSRASADSFHLLSLEKGAELELIERAGDWLSVKVLTSAVKGAVGVKGFVSRADVETVAVAEPVPPPPPPVAPRPSPRAAPTPRPAPTPPPSAEPPRPAPPRPPPVLPASEPAGYPDAGPAERRRFVFLVNAGVVPSKLEFGESRTFTEFAEEGNLEVENSYDVGFGGEVGLRYFFAERVGGEVVLSYTRRNGSAEFTGEFPHPLFLDRPRAATGTVDGLEYEEGAAHVNLVYGGGSGKLGYALFAGASFFFLVKPSLVGQPEYAHSFPFDSITLTDVPVLRESESAVGFNVGGELEYRFSDAVGAALAVRYSRASVEFAVDDTNTAKLDAGGPLVGLGLRVRF